MKVHELMLMFFLAGIVSGCGPDQANRIAHSRAHPPAPRLDTASHPALAAGLQVMQTRVLRKVDAYNEIVPTDTSRYFMHPAMDRDAIMEFNVSNLSSLTLSPRVSDLIGDCLNDAEAGEVEMSYALDDRTPIRLEVDREYDELIVVDVAGSNTMTIVVNHGNGVITCDWFGVGFLNLRES